MILRDQRGGASILSDFGNILTPERKLDTA
jgi:hypothetical protein